MPSQGPRCPGCGYEIFGLRDPRCPECGRALDVRDFAIHDDQGDRARRLHQHGRIGVGIGLALLSLPALSFIGLGAAFIYYGHVPPLGCIIIVLILGVWLWRVLAFIGREEWSYWKRRQRTHGPKNRE